MEWKDIERLLLSSPEEGFGKRQAKKHIMKKNPGGEMLKYSRHKKKYSFQ